MSGTCTDNLSLRPIGKLETKFYLRIIADDKPGVLACVSDVFAKHGVSIRSMIQPYVADGTTAELIFMTHTALDSDFEAALKEIENLECVEEIGTMIRVEGN